ncbi:cryptochrome/photolyase family protein [Sphingobium sp. CR28]|uniref:cryptochrome/photolyase family protein n=1 Tax=Sphingobium sp. CR28 TaxID=3400272 RepID=UPI003FEDBA61
MTSPVILWLRRDLRIADQPALLAACRAGPVIPVYVLDDSSPGDRAMGGASRWWLHHSLATLDRHLRERGSRLILRRGRAVDDIAKLHDETGASAVHALCHYEPWWRRAEAELAGRVDLQLHDGNYLLPPGALRTGSGTPYRIYTPFMRALLQHMPPATPQSAPAEIPAPSRWPASDRLEDWGLLPSKPDWAAGFKEEWTPGEAGAAARLEDFEDVADAYAAGRDLPAIEGSSRLSPHLHFGEISPARIWHALAGKGGRSEEGVQTFLKEIVWRDYAQNIILAMPDYATANGRETFDRLVWRDGREAKSDIAAWREGRTGYPIVDAGMRQLWATGWMHNRVRMIAASFLIKHLLVDWRVGERWFWDTLVDADHGNNAVNWQWVAGSGVDSNMFVRIMAPLTQSEKFEAADYIRQWVPELAALPDAAIHDPEAHSCRPEAYPPKIVGHKEARERALGAYARIK